jgi:glycosidase
MNKFYFQLSTFTAILLIFSQSLFSQTTIQRVEPPNWWVGMKLNKVQLLVYGEDIGDLQASISYAGLSLDQTLKVQSNNYLFLDLTISEQAQPGEVEIRFSEGDEVKATHQWSLLTREAGRDELKGFDNSDAIYLITPDRFANGDLENDDVKGMREKSSRKDKGSRHGGDIDGIRQNLPYIKDHGFTAIWLNPVLENDMKNFSYHGYACTDFYQVDRRFGSNKSYKQMVDEARSLGLITIMDMIVNHCGSLHWWMEDLPQEDFINQWDEMTYTNHQKTITQDPYASEADTKKFFDGWFDKTMPDLNQRNPLMATYLIQNSIWWVEYLGLAGIRMDTYPYPDRHFMSAWAKAIMTEYPHFNIVGEEWSEFPTVVSYWQKGKVNTDGYTSDLKSLMDFPVQAAFSRALNMDGPNCWRGLYELIAHDYLYANPMDMVIFPDNHDMSRVFTQVNEDFELTKMAMAFYTVMRGIPQFYYGTEILMKNPGTSDHGIIRSDFPGGWPSDRQNGFAGTGLSNAQRQAKVYLQKLLLWRQNATVIHQGKFKHFIPNDGMYVFFRYDENDKVMVIMNKNPEAKELELARFEEMLEGVSTGSDPIMEKVYTMESSLEVKGKTVLILELD